MLRSLKKKLPGSLKMWFKTKVGVVAHVGDKLKEVVNLNWKTPLFSKPNLSNSTKNSTSSPPWVLALVLALK